MKVALEMRDPDHGLCLHCRYPYPCHANDCVTVEDEGGHMDDLYGWEARKRRERRRPRWEVPVLLLGIVFIYAAIALEVMHG